MWNTCVLQGGMLPIPKVHSTSVIGPAVLASQNWPYNQSALYTQCRIQGMAYKGWNFGTSWFWRKLKGYWLLVSMRLRDINQHLCGIMPMNNEKVLENKVKYWSSLKNQGMEERDTTKSKFMKIEGMQLIKFFMHPLYKKLRVCPMELL